MIRKIKLRSFEVTERIATIKVVVETDAAITPFVKNVSINNKDSRTTSVTLIKAFKQLLDEIDEFTRA